MAFSNGFLIASNTPANTSLMLFTTSDSLSFTLTMAFFRDGCTLIGEVDYGLRRWRGFVYVWNDSPRRDELVAALRACVDVPADAIDYDGWPAGAPAVGH